MNGPCRRRPLRRRGILMALAGLALSCAAAADTVLEYTVPAREAAYGCDSVLVTPAGDTLRHHGQERMGVTRVWWCPRYADCALMRQKNVAGLEGQRDTLRVPSDTVATVYLTWRDAAGNGSDECRSNLVTINSATVGVETPAAAKVELLWYDVSGRRLKSLDGLTIEQVRLRVRNGVYLHREIRGGVARPKKIVVVR